MLQGLWSVELHRTTTTSINTWRYCLFTFRIYANYCDRASIRRLAAGTDLNSISTDPAYVDTLACITCNDTLDNAGAHSCGCAV